MIYPRGMSPKEELEELRRKEQEKNEERELEYKIQSISSEYLEQRIKTRISNLAVKIAYAQNEYDRGGLAKKIEFLMKIKDSLFD
jgi:hypothetical protein